MPSARMLLGADERRRLEAARAGQRRPLLRRHVAIGRVQVEAVDRRRPPLRRPPTTRAVLIKRQAAGIGRQAERRCGPLEVGAGEARELHAEQRSARRVVDARGEVLLHDEARGARRERVAAAREQRARAGLGLTRRAPQAGGNPPRPSPRVPGARAELGERRPCGRGRAGCLRLSVTAIVARRPARCGFRGGLRDHAAHVVGGERFALRRRAGRGSMRSAGQSAAAPIVQRPPIPSAARVANGGPPRGVRGARRLSRTTVCGQVLDALDFERGTSEYGAVHRAPRCARRYSSLTSDRKAAVAAAVLCAALSAVRRRSRRARR